MDIAVHENLLSKYWLTEKRKTRRKPAG